ncbi:putative sugar phosphate/phosphate translocator [Cinnamomum micranthum f. kanehirae]|uniref:Putative sugar phosphate/phosphate translocator n=1 Tax=Cinnamomum micranthum f. kanehirae TaxID=337451 RepID=A0A443PZU2_9MAGN|nr:putative sugar phosphate/phosphate translocator [Cinnamomum micranthum f. kanehirae]
MVEGSFDIEKGEGSEVSEVRKDTPVLRREPSFSGWCDEDGIEHIGQLDSSADSSDASGEDCNFELPLLQGGGSENESIDRGRQQFGDSEKGPVQSSISMPTLLKILFYILAWYTFSTCLTLYNKTLLGEKLGKFPAPMLMNTIHFAMQAVLSNVIVRFSKSLRPTVIMSWRDYFMRVVPTAIGTALDINLSNASLVFISVTFATMCKSASPIFLLLFAFAFKLESPSIKLLGIMVIISIGVLLTVARETEFELWGFIFVMLAAVMSGFRWSMTQILLQKEAYGLKHPLTLMSYVTPVMALGTALLSLIMDPWTEFKSSVYFNNSWHIIRSCLLLLLGGALAFFMVLTEYILVSATSAVTVTIAGVVKEAVTIMVAVFYFHDQFTLLKGIGLIIIMVGVSLFNWYKYQKLQKGQPSENDVERVSPTANRTAKYVILEDVDGQDDDA